jgi:acetyl-CoA acyltransferase 1
VLPPGGGASAARMAALHAGIPIQTSINTVNRQCSSGLTAINQIANQIRVGQIDIGIGTSNCVLASPPHFSNVHSLGAGVESMTSGFGATAAPDISDEVLELQDAEDCLIPMGITSENVAKDYKISRRAQDEFAAKSFQKAAAASKAGKFKAEIIPITAKFIDPKTEKVSQIVVDQDDGIRDGVTVESLAKLKPAFTKDGSTHAGKLSVLLTYSRFNNLDFCFPGNASQVSDGAAAVLLARRSVAKRLGLPILGKYVAAATVGVPPRIMGVGPAYAIPRVLELTGLSLNDIDFFEINEAFASQVVFSVQHLGIPWEKVNINGGAIAIGHPLGCSAYHICFLMLRGC